MLNSSRSNSRRTFSVTKIQIHNFLNFETMKKSVLFFLTTILIAQLGMAGSWRINNQLTASKAQRIFNQIQDAVDDFDVKNGDTLYVEGSPNRYESCSINKRLVIIGTGYFLGENPGIQIGDAYASVFSMDLASGSEGSIIYGLAFDSTNGGLRTVVDNILVQNCYINSFRRFLNVSADVKNVEIRGCYINSFNLSNVNGHTDLIFKNNIVSHGSLSDAGRLNISFTEFSNNTIHLERDGSFSVRANVFRNNILITEQAISVNLQVTVNEFNLSTFGLLGTENNNRNLDPGEMVVDPTFETGSPDGRYRIKEGSPYKNAGKDGVEPGAFGGPSPYRLSGTPPIPNITELETTGVGTQADGLPVTIKVRSF